jgi:hypothetical protein
MLSVDDMNEPLNPDPHRGAGNEAHGPRANSVVVDCDTCLVRSAAACGDCVVTVLLGAPPEGIRLADSEVNALDVLAHEGLIPPLRLVTPLTSRDIEAS